MKTIRRTAVVLGISFLWVCSAAAQMGGPMGEATQQDASSGNWTKYMTQMQDEMMHIQSAKDAQNQWTLMQEHMQHMYQGMPLLQADWEAAVKEKNPEKRRELWTEHLRKMQETMSIMSGMSGMMGGQGHMMMGGQGYMMGGQGNMMMGGQGTQAGTFQGKAEIRIQMMETQMHMMQTIMEQMFQAQSMGIGQ